MNTHPTHTRVWVGWRLRPLIVPIGVDVFFCFVFIVPTTPWRMGGCFGCVHVFYVHFLECWCVCVECVFPLSNIVNYRKKFIFIYDSILPSDHVKGKQNRSYVMGSHGIIASRASTRHFCLPYVPGTLGEPTSGTG